MTLFKVKVVFFYIEYEEIKVKVKNYQYPIATS
jgi:hypothetical protein